ncbi:DUF3307 domain-containing protein [Nioella aestuarii]|uniref:DUF3307 domain-containing protein n=1 Tax=Nioella aestuarii TaxID=1662864 RepID=UPI003D7FEBDE
MIETVVALLFAHVLADFMFQSKAMALGKDKIGPLLLHTGIVFGLSYAALGGAHWAALFVAALHMQIDYAKARLGSDDSLAHFLIDQGAHLMSILAAGLLWTDAYASGLWGHLPILTAQAPEAMALIAGFLLATRAGQFAVGKLMAPYAAALPDAEGLSNGGAVIGLLERGLTFILVLSGQMAGVGFLIAAKSFLRVGSIEKDRTLAEYVIIGTLASIGWALLAGIGTAALISRLGGA